MSAWMVSKGHIDCLVQASIVEGLTSVVNADATGRMLWDENWASVSYLYDGDETMLPDGFAGYRFHGIEAPLDDLTVWKQARCYEYQSCEHPGWEGSSARSLVDALATRLVGRNGGDVDALYDRAGDRPWGIEAIEEAVAKQVIEA